MEQYSTGTPEVQQEKEQQVKLPPPRHYQREAAEFLVHKRRIALGDPPGTGKTRSILMGLQHLKALNERLVILAPTNALYTWHNELLKWYGHDIECPIHTVHGNITLRRKLWASAGIHITTYEAFQNDVTQGIVPTPHIEAMVLDEVHRKMRNRKTKRFEFFRSYLQRPRIVAILSGTLVRHGAQDLWPILHILAPREFSSYWRFVNEHCFIEKNPWGGSEIIGVRDKEKLKRIIASRVMFRPKRELLPELPPKTRQALLVEMDPKQAKMYKSLEEDMWLELEGQGTLLAPTPLAVLTRLRQVLICPRVLDQAPSIPYGGGIETIVEHSKEREERHFVIFMPLTKAIPILKTYLVKEGFPHVYVFQGGMKPEEVAQSERLFKKNRGVALISIDFAQSFNLETCSLGYFLGCSYNPDDNIQAEDRLWRMTSQRGVNIYYLQHRGTVEDHILEGIVDGKFRSANDVLRDLPNFKIPQGAGAGDLKN